MKTAGRYFNLGCLKIFQKSLRALFHSPLQLYIPDTARFNLNQTVKLLLNKAPHMTAMTPLSKPGVLNVSHCKLMGSNNI